MYIGNEFEQVSGRITSGDDYYYYYDYYENITYNEYEDWTDLNGNTIVIILLSDSSVQSTGFDLEFKCKDQFSLPTCSQLMVHHDEETGDRLMCR